MYKPNIYARILVSVSVDVGSITRVSVQPLFSLQFLIDAIFVRMIGPISLQPHSITIRTQLFIPANFLLLILTRSLRPIRLHQVLPPLITPRILRRRMALPTDALKRPRRRLPSHKPNIVVPRVAKVIAIPELLPAIALILKYVAQQHIRARAQGESLWRRLCSCI